MNAIPASIGPYKVLRRIGVGGMGQVHECITGGGARVAVKTILEEYRHHPEVRERFRSEIAASKAIRGPYVADYFDSNEDELWLATRFYPWPSLREHIAEHGPLSVEETVALAGRVAEALHDIHAAGRVHRDLTPTNILYLNGDVRVIDYGISRDLSIRHGAGLTGDQPPPYTWRYASPEHIAGKPVNELADYFSLGCVLAFAAAGHELLDELRIKSPELVPAALRPLVAALTHDDPGLRPTYQVILDWTASLEPSPDGPSDTPAVSTDVPVIQGLAVARLQDNHLDLFATDNQPGHVLHRHHTRTQGWSDWVRIHLPDRHADRNPRNLAAATRSSGSSDLLAVLDNGLILHRSYWPGTGWSEWVDLASGLPDQPIAIANVGDNGLDLYTTDSNGHLLHRNQNNREWSEWSYMTPPTPPTHDFPIVRMPAGSGGWKVTHLTAAGTGTGERHLVVGLDNQALAYSAQRQQDRWSDWVWVTAADALACVTLSADEESARGVVAHFHGDGDLGFFEHWHLWRRPWIDFETVLGQRLPIPWSDRTIIDLGSSIARDGIWELIALLDDGTILHRTTSADRKEREWNVVQNSGDRQHVAEDRTRRLPPLPPTRPLTGRGD